MYMPCTLQFTKQFEGVGLTQCLATEAILLTQGPECWITSVCHHTQATESFYLCMYPLISFAQEDSRALALIQLQKQRTELREAQQFGLKSRGLEIGWG